MRYHRNYCPFEKVSTQPSLAIPDRAMSVRQILDRFRATGVIEGAATPVYGVADPAKSDLIDRYMNNLQVSRAVAEAKVQEREKAAAEAAAKVKAEFDAAVEKAVQEKMKASQS